MTRPETFAVWQFFEDGWHTKVEEGMTAQGAVEFVRRYIERPAVKMGIVRRVIIVDDGDNTVFDWQTGLGVVYPPYDQTTGKFVADERES